MNFLLFGLSYIRQGRDGLKRRELGWVKLGQVVLVYDAPGLGYSDRSFVVKYCIVVLCCVGRRTNNFFSCLSSSHVFFPNHSAINFPCMNFQAKYLFIYFFSPEHCCIALVVAKILTLPCLAFLIYLVTLLYSFDARILFFYAKSILCCVVLPAV